MTNDAAQKYRDTLLQKQREIAQRIKALDARENAKRRKAETKAKIILGSALLKRPEAIKDFLPLLAPKDIEHLQALGIAPTSD